MADDGIYTTNAQIANQAGANVNATAITVAETDKFVLLAEAYVNAKTRTNWSDLVTAGLNADVQGILTLASAALCAINAINYDMSVFATRSEAETMMDVLRDRHVQAMKALEDMKVRTFIEGA